MDQQSRAYSIHIGVNSVHPLYYDGWEGKLKACENDAEAMYQIAKHLNYDESYKLFTEEATADNFQKRLNDLGSRVRAGDTLWITYSGHGSQTKNFDPIEKDDDLGFDEAFCLYDGLWLDDQNYTFFKSLPKDVNVCLIADCCHSGTIGRKKLDKLGDEFIPRVLPDHILTNMINKLYDKGLIKILPKKKNMDKKEYPELQANVWVMAACKDEELAYEKPPHGLFTQTILKIWDEGKFDKSYHIFQEEVIDKIPRPTADKWIQHPVFTAYGPDSKRKKAELPFFFHKPKVKNITDSPILIDGESNDFSFQDGNLILRDIKGLKMEAWLHKGLIPQHQTLTVEQAIRESLAATDGEWTQSLQLSIVEDNSNPDNDDFQLVIPTIEGKRFGVFFTDESGEGEWILAEEKDLDEWVFEIPKEMPSEIDNDYQGTRIIRIIHWERQDAGKSRQSILAIKPYNLLHIEYKKQIGNSRNRVLLTKLPDPSFKRAEYQRFWDSFLQERSWEKDREEIRIFLIVHGTNGKTTRSYKNLLHHDSTMEALEKMYKHRILAFDHPSIMEGPHRNAVNLRKYLEVAGIPETGVPIRFDILTKSRGCLIIRDLIEEPLKKHPLNPRIMFNKLIMLAGPNQGTPSASSLGKMMRTAFWIVRKLRKTRREPFDRKEQIQDDSILAFIDTIEETEDDRAVAILPGISAMDEEGAYIKRMNENLDGNTSARILGTKYYAIVSHYDPSGYPKSKRIAKKLAEKLYKTFGGRTSDGINPAVGAYGAYAHSGNRKIPKITSIPGNFNNITTREIIGSTEIHHENYYEFQEIHTQILDFLKE